jgi:hypothetical protein
MIIPAIEDCLATSPVDVVLHQQKDYSHTILLIHCIVHRLTMYILELISLQEQLAAVEECLASPPVDVVLHTNRHVMRTMY